jgi:hypothetical protein
MSLRRTCQGCGFEGAEEGKACPLCGAVAVQEEEIVDSAGPDAVPGIDEAIRDVGAGAAEAHRCASCQTLFVVVYEPEPGEDKCDVPVACPSCWKLNQVPVGRGAAESEQYRVEKA